MRLVAAWGSTVRPKGLEVRLVAADSTARPKGPEARLVAAGRVLVPSPATAGHQLQCEVVSPLPSEHTWCTAPKPHASKWSHTCRSAETWSRCHSAESTAHCQLVAELSHE